jgi:hypothetical protein
LGEDIGELAGVLLLLLVAVVARQSRRHADTVARLVSRCRLRA